MFRQERAGHPRQDLLGPSKHDDEIYWLSNETLSHRGNLKRFAKMMS